jgi:hypothetical protein
MGFGNLMVNVDHQSNLLTQNKAGNEHIKVIFFSVI